MLRKRRETTGAAEMAGNDPAPWALKESDLRHLSRQDSTLTAELSALVVLAVTTRVELALMP
jgi:hypothetical protein